MKDRATSLHVAALPFPSPQGTQAAIRFMMEASRRCGERAALLTYAHGDGETITAFPHVRAPALVADRSLRSGPSLGKIVNDIALARALAAHPSDDVVAHHVEAAAIATLGRRPWVFVAHTDLAAELPTYFARSMKSPLHRAGARLDRELGRRAGALAAVSPLLASVLADRCERAVHALPIPWPVPAPIEVDERSAARAAQGLAEHAHVVLYAGNLDVYQGLEVLFDALARLRAAGRDVRLCVASVDGRVGALGPDVHLLPLGSERDRRAAHALADVVVVPRRTPGGLPVKLLDALSRGCAVVTVPRALAGHAIAPLLCAARDDDADALAAALDRQLGASRERRLELGMQARAHVSQHHAGARFVDALERARTEARRATPRAG